MTDMEQPKRRPGRPPKYAGQGKRQNFNFRITEKLRERLIESARQTGRSLSEEIEFRVTRDLAWEEARSDIMMMHAEARAAVSASRIQALRIAGFQILREIEARPTRAVVDIEVLLAEADGLMHGLRSGFFDSTQPLPAIEPSRPMTAEEARAADERAMRELEALRHALLPRGWHGSVTMSTDNKIEGENPMNAWNGLTDGQARELAREFCVAIAKADRPEELPSDAWLDGRLRDLGCPGDQLETWRARIKAFPLTKLADGAA